MAKYYAIGDSFDSKYYKTTDHTALTPVNIPSVFTDMAFFDDKLYAFNADDAFISTDDGVTFTPILNYEANVGGIGQIGNLKEIHVDADGIYIRGSSYIVHSTDDGASWSVFYNSGDAQVGEQTISSFNKVMGAAGGYLYFATDTHLVYKAKNNTGNAIALVPDDNIYAVAGDPNNNRVYWANYESGSVKLKRCTTPDQNITTINNSVAYVWKMFADDNKIILAAGDHLHVSTDSGVNFSEMLRDDLEVRGIDYDGTEIIAAFLDYNTFGCSYVISSDFGNSFTEYTVSQDIKWANINTPSNAAPTDISLSNNTIAEENTIDSVIGTFSATDADAGDTHTFSLVAGTGDDDNEHFSIVGNELRAGIVFDYETKSSYSIRVRATDSGEAFFEEQFTININNAAEILSSTELPGGAVIAEINDDPTVAPPLINGSPIAEGSIVRNTSTGQKFIKVAGDADAFVAIEIAPKPEWAFTEGGEQAWAALQSK